MRFALMIEGQEGVGWDDWLALAGSAEAGGFEALLRSDHYLPFAQGDGALDAWGTICALGAVTERILLGTLVLPFTIRPAAILAKLALTADHISGGRIDLGIGTGWHEDEHKEFGFPFPPMPQRFDELARQVDEILRDPAPDRPPAGAAAAAAARHGRRGQAARRAARGPPRRPVQPRLRLARGGLLSAGPR